MLTTQSHLLPSGLRILTSPLSSIDSVTVMILVRAGSRFETKENSGIAHFLEHMFFKGGDRYPTPKSVSEAIDSIGGSFNAFTSYEFVGYYVKVAKEHIETAFDVLSDMLLNAQFDPEAIKREKGVILEEYRMYLDNPKHLAATALDSILFGNHPLGWDIIGTPATIRSFKRDDFIGYRSKLYTASNIVVAVAGNATMPQVKALVTKYLPYPASRKVNKPLAYKAAQPVAKTAQLVSKPTEQAHLMLGTRSFGGNHKNRHAAGLLATILGGGMSSRLFTAVREELGLAYYVYAFNQSYTDTGYFGIAAGVDKKRLDLAIDCIFGELRKVIAEGVTEAELKKAKDYSIGHLVLELEQSDEIAHLFGTYWLLYGRQIALEEIKRQIQSVTLPDIKRVARHLFTDQSIALTVVGPKILSAKVQRSYKLNTK